MAERRYQVKSDAANRLILELLDVAGVPLDRRGLYQQLLITALKLNDDEALVGDLRIAATALKELRYAFKVFAPLRWSLVQVAVALAARVFSRAVPIEPPTC